MIILGVDPGTLVTGFAVIELHGGSLKMLDAGLVKNPAAMTMPLRLKCIYDKLTAVIDEYHPDEFAIETAFYGKNIQSTLKIGHARGVCMLSAANSLLPTSEYAPREVKRAVTGNGNASKQQVRFMVASILQLKHIPKVLDVSDAMAVAICHAQRANGAVRLAKRTASRSRGGRSAWAEFIRTNPHRVMSKQ